MGDQPSETRKLSTILFADIAGYTTLMQTDEALAMRRLNLFEEILERTVPQHQGQIVQYFGDACLLSFESATEGVRCGVDLQSEFKAADIPIRMGIHLGDVVFKNDNVFGDGVNIASRIESISVPGAILLSRSVRNQIQNKSEFSLTSIGSFRLKNVKEPVEIFAVSNTGFVVPKRKEVQEKINLADKGKRRKYLIPTLLLIAIGSGIAAWYLNGESAAISPSQKGEIPENQLAINRAKNLSPRVLTGAWEFIYFYSNDSTLLYRGDLQLSSGGTTRLQANFKIKAPKSRRIEEINAKALEFSDGKLSGELSHELYKIQGGHMLEQFEFVFSDAEQFTGTGRCVAYCAEGTESLKIIWRGTKSSN